MTRSISSRFTGHRVLLTGATACSLFLTACGGTALPTTAPTTTTSGTSISARGGFIATLIPLTEAPAVASPRVAGGSVTPRSGGNTFPTSTSSNAGTVVRGNTTPAGTAATGTRIWTDPGNSIQLQYPAVWRATTAMMPNDDDLHLDGPDNQTIFVDIFSSDATGPAPTTDEALQLIRDAQTRSAQYTYTYGMEQDVKVGGEAAKYLEYQYTPRANQTAPAAQGAIWVIQRGDHTYMIRASNIGMGRADVDKIISSVAYPAPALASAAAIPATRSTTAITPPASVMPRTSGTTAPGAIAPLVRGTASLVTSPAASPATSPVASPASSPPSETPTAKP